MQENKKGASGIIIMLISAVCFSTSGMFFKFISWGPISINGARNLIGSGVLALFMFITKHKIKINRSVFTGAACVFLTSLLFSYANKMTSSANAIVLQFTMPIFVILFMALFYHKKPIPSDIFACVGIFGGIVCFFIDGLSSGGMFGNFLALCSGCTYAGVFMMNINFSEKLKQLRKNKGITQQALADAIGEKRSIIANYESNNSTPGFEVLNKIVHHEKLKDVPKILETPYIEKVAPYKLSLIHI